MEPQQEQKSRRKSSKPIRNWRAVTSEDIVMPFPHNGESDGDNAIMDNPQVRFVNNCEIVNTNLKAVQLRPIDIESLHYSEENYTEPNDPITVQIPVISKNVNPAEEPIGLIRSHERPLGVPQQAPSLIPMGPSRVSLLAGSFVPPACTTKLPISVTRQDLESLREKSVAIKTCMSMTMEEIECLIRGNMVVKVSNRKKPDQSLKYPCKFCIWFNHETNGQVRLRSFGRKEEIKRHHMLHLRYERFQCQYCPYKVVRSDHLHRHMKNKHPEVNHPGPQSNRRKRICGDGYEYDQENEMISLPPHFGQNLHAQGLSALLQNHNNPLAALNTNLQSLLQAGLLNTHNNSPGLNLLGRNMHMGGFNSQMITEVDEVDEYDDDGTLVIACEDESDESEEFDESPPMINPQNIQGQIKTSRSPPANFNVKKSLISKFNLNSNTEETYVAPQPAVKLGKDQTMF